MVQTAIAETDIAIDLIRTDVVATILAKATLTPTLTLTPTMTFTPTITITPTITPTPTNTPTPFNKSKCRSISIAINREFSYDKEIRTKLSKYANSCVSVYYETYIFGENLYEYALLDNFIDSFDINIITDAETPPSISRPSMFSRVWGILILPENESLNIQIALRDVEEYPINQQPIINEGLFEVGKESMIFPGVWKSANLPIWTSECYWARINPSSGSIKVNHFGIAGMTIRVYEGEVFETNGECTPWYFVKQ